jgi:hypothetical protein
LLTRNKRLDERNGSIEEGGRRKEEEERRRGGRGR